MGTSGPLPPIKNNRPLLPSWLNEPLAPDVVDPAVPVDAGPQVMPGGPANDYPPGAPNASDMDAQPTGPSIDAGSNTPEAPSANAQPNVDGDVPPPSSSFTAGRGNFTRYAKSRGEDRRSMGRAARSYVRSAAGGARTAARRMASERAAAGALSRLLSGAAASGGIREFVRTVNLVGLADRPVGEIYAALVDYVCPADGTLDDAYAREAYLEAVAELVTAERDLEQPTAATAREFMESFIANAVRLRIINAIANGIVAMPCDLEVAREINAGLMDFIRGCVADALEEAVGVLQADAFQAEITDIFERVVRFVDDRADDAAEGRE